MTETDALQALRLAWPESMIEVSTTVHRSMLENSTEVLTTTTFHVFINWLAIHRSGEHLQLIVRELCDLARLEKYKQENKCTTPKTT